MEICRSAVIDLEEKLSDSDRSDLNCSFGATEFGTQLNQLDLLTLEKYQCGKNSFMPSLLKGIVRAHHWMLLILFECKEN